MATFRELELPKEVLDKIKEYCAAQSSKFNLDARSDSGANSGGFTWSRTLEGDDFWKNIVGTGITKYTVDLTEFYIVYPSKFRIEEVSGDSRTYIVSNKSKRYKITIERL